MNLESAARILVVDDEETMRRSLADILRLEGYRVQAVATGEAAVEAIQKETYDLLLLDLKMPGMDGVDVMRTAARLAPETMIIFLTAHGSLESAIQALRQEVSDYLLKPASPQQVLKSVAAALSKRAERLHKRLLLEKLDSSLQELKDVEHREVSYESPHSMVSLGGGIYVDLNRREIWQETGSGEPTRVKLTTTEGKLLRVLLDNRGHVLSHRELVARVQGYDVTDWEAPEVLRPLVSRLRQKLSHFSGGADWIVNVRGTGYVFEQRKS